MQNCCSCPLSPGPLSAPARTLRPGPGAIRTMKSLRLSRLRTRSRNAACARNGGKRSERRMPNYQIEGRSRHDWTHLHSLAMAEERLFGVRLQRTRGAWGALRVPAMRVHPLQERRRVFLHIRIQGATREIFSKINGTVRLRRTNASERCWHSCSCCDGPTPGIYQPPSPLYELAKRGEGGWMGFFSSRMPSLRDAAGEEKMDQSNLFNRARASTANAPSLICGNRN
jgi:hypothetical protein